MENSWSGILKEGWLSKEGKGKSFFMGKNFKSPVWKKRWAILRSTSLELYQNDKDTSSPLRVIDLKNEAILIEREQQMMHKNVLKLVTTNQIYFFETENTKELISWYEKLVEQISKLHKNQSSNYSKFSFEEPVIRNDPAKQYSRLPSFIGPPPEALDVFPRRNSFDGVTTADSFINTPSTSFINTPSTSFINTHSTSFVNIPSTQYTKIPDYVGPPPNFSKNEERASSFDSSELPSNLMKLTTKSAPSSPITGLKRTSSIDDLAEAYNLTKRKLLILKDESLANQDTEKARQYEEEISQLDFNFQRMSQAIEQEHNEPRSEVEEEDSPTRQKKKKINVNSSYLTFRAKKKLDLVKENAKSKLSEIVKKYQQQQPSIFEEFQKNSKGTQGDDYFRLLVKDNPNIIEKRIFYRAFPFKTRTWKNKNFSEGIVFLFSDSVLFTKVKVKKEGEVQTQHLKIKFIVPLQNTRLILCANDEVYQHSFQLVHDRDQTFTFALPNDPSYVSIKDSWFKEIKTLLKNFQIQKANFLRESQLMEEEKKKFEELKRKQSIQEITPKPEKIEVEKKTLHEILEEKDLALYYRQFLHKHLNNENFSFYLEADEYKNRTPDFGLELRAKEIYNKYLKSGAEMELNVPAKLRKEVESNLDNPPRDLFVAMQKDIQELLEGDSIPRFLASDYYLDYKSDKKMLNSEEFKRNRRNTSDLVNHFILASKQE